MINISFKEEQLQRCKDEYFNWLESLFSRNGSLNRIISIINYFDLWVQVTDDYNLSNNRDRRKFLVDNRKTIIDQAFSLKLSEKRNFQIKLSSSNVLINLVLVCNNKLKLISGETLYTFFRGSDLPFKLYKEVLGISVCPYCNKNSLEYIEYDNTVQSRMDIDHIKPRWQHPNLAIHFFNLMPSCHTCNFIKSKAEYVSLFDVQNADFKFKIDYKNMEYNDIVKLHLSEEIKVVIVKEVLDLLKLESRYNSDQPKIKSILERKYWYNNEYVKLLNETKKSIIDSNTEFNIYEMLELHYDERYYFNTPYSKLTKELLEHIDVISKVYR
ncbi:HNH endonuclease signature motif containing protein [Salinicoccus kekensis]|uniref:HNH endonuclease n=1 Tax=Salinicoccus kekensis TaxID=714307 RepID=A0A285U6K2_9STAP|nr:HNH endonuclease signature motif containing protein [Salinicoccus kekensis]SOC37570.1 hypothetical protein SAMN05878391_0012 [Salinicoccus kekensis]